MKRIFILLVVVFTVFGSYASTLVTGKVVRVRANSTQAHLLIGVREMGTQNITYVYVTHNAYMEKEIGAIALQALQNGQTVEVWYNGDPAIVDFIDILPE